MTDITVTFLLVAVVYSWIYILGRTVIRSRKSARIRELLRREQNRNRFGELRTRLFQLAALGEVPTDTERFQVMSSFLTFLMRQPHRYPEAAQATIASLPLQEAGLQKKEQVSSIAEARFFVDTASALDQLCRDYDVVYRGLAKVADQMHLPPLWLKTELGKSSKRSFVPERVATVVRLERHLRDLGKSALGEECCAVA